MSHSFLSCYDYGTGGIWLLLDASSHEDAQSKYPWLQVFETRPEWMSEAQEREFRADCERLGQRWNVDCEPTGWLLKAKEEHLRK